MQTNITQNLDANLAVARINVTANANGMKRGFDVTGIRIAESLHRLPLSTRSAFAYRPAMKSFGMMHDGIKPDGMSGAEHKRSLERCYLDKPDTATTSTSLTSTAVKPSNGTTLQARPWRSQSSKGFGRNQAMVQSLVNN